MIPARFAGGWNEALRCGGGSWAIDAIARVPRYFFEESNPARVIDVFVDALDLAELSFQGGEAGGDRSAVIPSLGSPEALHLGYLNRVQSSR
jgi:hypothetical protein